MKIENIQKDQMIIEELMTTASLKLRGVSTAMQLSFIASLFDHVCEVNYLDKPETLDLLNRIIRDVNSDLGDMYTQEV